MSSSLIATAALVGGALGQGMPPLTMHLCPEGGSFMPQKELDGSTCLQKIIGSGMGDMTNFDEASCNMPIPDDPDMTVADGLMYLQYTCCEGGEASGHGLCGDNFKEGNVCADSGAFDPQKGMGEFHCQGDERMMDPRDCMFDGHSGWDENEDEKCDIGRMDIDESMHETACATLGGSWVEHKCFETNMWIMGMMKDYPAGDMSWCTNYETRYMFDHMKSCCRDGMTMLEHCPAPAPSPMGDGPATGFCKNMEKYDPMARTGHMHCNGQSEITSKEKCMPFGRDDAWDEMMDPDDGDKCDIQRMDLDDDKKGAACADIGLAYEGQLCQSMSMWIFEYGGMCSFEGFGYWYETTLAPYCCSGTEIAPAHCGGGDDHHDGGDDHHDDHGDHHEGCARVSADAIRMARMKGFEPKFCA